MSDLTAYELGRFLPVVTDIKELLSFTSRDIFIDLPLLRGYWPMAIVSSTGNAEDHGGAGAGLALPIIGTPTYGYDGDGYVQTGGGANYLSRAGGELNVSGLEAWVDVSIAGMTVGGWFFVDALPTVAGGMVNKSSGPPNRSYELFLQSGGTFRFVCSGDGASLASVVSDVVDINQWVFVVARYNTASSISIFVNGSKTTSTLTIPSSLFVTAAAFEVGRHISDNTRMFDGRARDVFLCASALDDDLIVAAQRASEPSPLP